MNKKVIITGASSGIGKELAVEFYKNGYDVGLMARREELLSGLAQQLQTDFPNKGKVCYHTLDVGIDSQVAPAVKTLIEELGGMDIMIANAGTTSVTPTGKGLLEEHKRVIDVNLTGAIATVEVATEHFRTQKSGHIVGVSSVSAYLGIPGSAAYSASKAALTNYLYAVRVEMLNKNIKVSVVHPGFINTDFSPGMDKRPLVIEADVAAKEIYKGIIKKKKNIIVPFMPWRFLVHIVQLLPDSLVKKMY